MINNPDLNDISHEVLAAFEKYMKVYFTERDVEKTFAMFDEEMTVIGSAPDEVALDPVDITYHSIKVDLLSPTIGLVKALISIKTETGNNLIEINRLRLSVIFRRTGNDWRIIHNHISSPTSKYADGESYPIKIEEALRESEDRYHSILAASPDARDITQRKRTEEKLLLEMRLLSTIIENIPDQIYYKDLESRFIMCNPAARKPASVVTDGTGINSIQSGDGSFAYHDGRKPDHGAGNIQN
jgi:hypothetical protein